MKIRCMKCEIVRELTKEELQETGEFVEKRKLRAVGFLKILSLDMRELCNNGKNHEWTFEDGFDKEIHSLAAEVKTTKGVVTAAQAEEIECARIIAETTAKMEAAKQRVIENEAVAHNLLSKMGEISYIKDETLWL